MEASVFLVKIENLNDIASAIKTKSSGKKLPLREVYLKQRKNMKNICENITGSREEYYFSKKVPS